MRVQGAGSTAMEWPHRWSVHGEAGCTSRVRRSWPNPDEMHDKTKEGKVWGKARRDQVPCSRHTLCIDGLCERPWLHEPGLRARAHPVAQRHMAHVRLGWDDVRECGERQGHGKATVVKLAELRRGSAKRPDASLEPVHKHLRRSTCHCHRPLPPAPPAPLASMPAGLRMSMAVFLSLLRFCLSMSASRQHASSK